MQKRHWDDPIPPARWDTEPDPERFERKRLAYRDMPSSGIRVGKSLTSDLPVFITPRQLSTHMQVVGSTGLGKSYYLEGIIKSLILQGHGVCVIDPHGDLYHRLLDFCVYRDRVQPERNLSSRVVPFDV